MEISECHIIISHVVHGLSRILISEESRIAFDKCMEALLCDQIHCDLLDLLRRASVQCGDRHRIADLTGNTLDIFRGHTLKYILMPQQIFLTGSEYLRVLRMLHRIQETVDLLGLYARKVISHTDIELEAIHAPESELFRHHLAQEPCLDVLLHRLGNIQLCRPLAVVALVVCLDARLVDAG